MSTYTVSKWILPIIVSLAVPAASKAQTLISNPLPANTNPGMLSGMTAAAWPDPQAGAFEIFSFPRTYRSIRVWGRSTTPVPMFRVTVAMGTQREGRPLNANGIVFDSVVAPYRIVTHPQDSQLRQYTLGITAPIPTSSRVMFVVARDTRFGTPWTWVQNPGTRLGWITWGDGNWYFLFDAFVIDIADFFL